MAVVRDKTAPVNTGTGSGTRTSTFATNPAAGDKVILAVWCYSTTAPSSVTDNASNAYTQDKSFTGNSGDANLVVRLYRADNIALPGAGTLAVSAALPADGSVCAIAYTGVATGAPTASNTNFSASTQTGGNSAAAGGAVTGLQVGAQCFFGTINPENIATSAPFSQQGAENDGNSFLPGAVSDQLNAGATGTATWTWTTASRWSALIVAYDSASPSVVTAAFPPARPPGRIAPSGLWSPIVGSTEVAAGANFTASLAGGITPTAALISQPQKGLAGAAIPTGALIKQAQKSPAGATTPSGAALKLVGKLLGGSVTPTGTLTTIRTRLLSLAGSITPTGHLANQVGKALAGAVAPAGAAAKQVNKALAGSITPSGALTTIRTRLLAIAGAITPSGSIVRQTGKALSGSQAPTGQLVLSTQRRLTGSITPAGTVAATRNRLIALAGAVVPTGALLRAAGKALAGSTQPAGAVTKRLSRLLAGSASPSGVALKLLGRLLAGSAAPSGAVTTQTLANLVTHGTASAGQRTAVTSTGATRTSNTATGG